MTTRWNQSVTDVVPYREQTASDTWERPLWSREPWGEADFMARRQRPRQLHRADVFVPVALVLTLGGLITAFCYVIFTFLDQLMKGPHAMAKTRLMGAALVGIGAAVVVTCLILRRMYRDGFFGQVIETEEVQAIRSGSWVRDKERLVLVNAPQAKAEVEQQERETDQSRFATFVSQLQWRGTSYESWAKHLDRPTYTQYRAALLRLGWARWKGKGPNAGWELNPSIPVEDMIAKIEGKGKEKEQ